MRAGDGAWRHTPAWARAFVAAAPWATVALLVAMFAVVSVRVTAAPGLAFELPECEVAEAQDDDLAAIVAPVPGQEDRALVFFDDARYVLGDPQSVALLREQLLSHVQAGSARATLLVLADRRVSAGELMKLVGIARESGVRHVQIAERRE